MKRILAFILVVALGAVLPAREETPAREARPLDVFCSKKDWITLGLMTRVVGTADRRWAARVSDAQ